MSMKTRSVPSEHSGGISSAPPVSICWVMGTLHVELRQKQLTILLRSVHFGPVLSFVSILHIVQDAFLPHWFLAISANRRG